MRARIEGGLPVKCSDLSVRGKGEWLARDEGV